MNDGGGMSTRASSAPRRGVPAFSPAEVARIRSEWDGGSIDVRGWALAKGCSPETIRRIGRRDTYSSWTDAAPVGGPEPNEADLEAALKRFEQAVGEAPPTGRSADAMLEQMTKRAKDPQR